MKTLLLLALILFSYAAVIIPQIKSKSINRYSKNYSDEDLINRLPDKDQYYQLQKINQLIRDNNDRRLKTILYKPAKITVDNIRFTYTYNDKGNCLTEIKEQSFEGAWENKTKFIYRYDDSGNLISETDALWENGEWVNSFNYYFTYDKSDNLLTYVYEQWSFGFIVNAFKYTYQYDNSGNCLERLYEEWLDSTYIHSKRRTCTYDSNNRLLTDLYERWTDGAWVNLWRYTYTYDNSGNCLENLEETWSNGIWDKFWRESFSYDSSGNLLTEVHEEWADGVVKTSYRYTFAYDSSGNCLTRLHEEWLSGIWINSYRNIYTYDNKSNYLSDIFENWINDSWKGSNKTTYTYDKSSRCIIELHEDFQDSIWVNSYRKKFAYDISGNQLSVHEEQWDNLDIGSWNNFKKISYSYDNHSNTVHAESAIWAGEMWILYPDYLNIRYDDHNGYRKYNASVVDVEYISIISAADIAERNLKAGTYSLSQNYPNPFNPSTVITYQLPVTGFVELTIYDLLGREVAILVNEEKTAGDYKVKFDAGNISSGIYYYQLKAGEVLLSKKMLLLK